MFPEGEKLLWEGMVFLAFALVCGALVERRFSRLVSAAVAGGCACGRYGVLQGALLARGLDRTLALRRVPVTAYVLRGARFARAVPHPAGARRQRSGKWRGIVVDVARRHLLQVFAMRQYNGAYVALASSLSNPSG